MTQRPNRSRLVLEPDERVSGIDQVGRQHLYGYVAAEPRIARPVNRAHAARAERRDDFVRAQAAAYQCGHGAYSLVRMSE
jgi:hypothetical protein